MIEQIQKLADDQHKAGKPLPATVRVHDFQDGVDYFSRLANLSVGDEGKPAQIMGMRVIEDKSVPAGRFRVQDDWGHTLHEGKIDESGIDESGIEAG